MTEDARAPRPAADGPGPGLVLVFDMDGVLLDTEAVKTAAFRDAFAPLCGTDPATLAAVDTYNRRHRGVPRALKIAHLTTAVLGLPQPAAAAGARAVTDRYAALLAARLPRCAPVPGLPELLEAVPAVRHVASSAPVAEIEANLRRSGIGHHFTRLYGHPVTKAEALRDIARRHPGAEPVFFGDAPADLAAARATGTRFVAVNPHPDLVGQVPQQLPDFRALGEVVELLYGGRAGRTAACGPVLS